jgi:hypothetical protein
LCSQVTIKIHPDLDQLHLNGDKNQIIEISWKSMTQIYVTFSLPTIIIYCNNMVRIMKRVVNVAVHILTDPYYDILESISSRKRLHSSALQAHSFIQTLKLYSLLKMSFES